MVRRQRGTRRAELHLKGGFARNRRSGAVPFPEYVLGGVCLPALAVLPERANYFVVFFVTVSEEVKFPVKARRHVARRDIKSPFPKPEGLARLPQVEKTQGAVVEAVGSVRGSLSLCPRVVFACFLPVDRRKRRLHIGKTIRLRGEASVQKLPHGFRNRHSASCVLIKSSGAVSGVRPGFPQALPYVHLENREREGIDIHPALRFFSGGLLCGAVLRSVAGWYILTGGRGFRCVLAGGRGFRCVLAGGRGLLVFPDLGDSEISHLHVPVRCQQNIAGLDVLMYEAVRLGISEASRGLDGHIQNPLPDFLLRPFVERAVPDLVLQAASVHPLRKNRRHTADLADVVTAYDVGVKPQPDPVVAFLDERFLAVGAGFREKPRFRALHGKIYVPAHVVHAVDAAHAALDRLRNHPVSPQQVFAAADTLV